MSSGMYLTMDDLRDGLPTEAFSNIGALRLAISRVYSCGMSEHTLTRILEDYKKIRED